MILLCFALGLSTRKVGRALLPNGVREIIDFRQAHSESQTAWEGFLNDLYRRGLRGEALKLIVVDGGKGLGAALPFVYGQVPVQ